MVAVTVLVVLAGATLAMHQVRLRRHRLRGQEANDNMHQVSRRIDDALQKLHSIGSTPTGQAQYSGSLITFSESGVLLSGEWRNGTLVHATVGFPPALLPVTPETIYLTKLQVMAECLQGAGQRAYVCSVLYAAINRGYLH
jgi:hypothetical protein